MDMIDNSCNNYKITTKRVWCKDLDSFEIEEINDWTFTMGLMYDNGSICNTGCADYAIDFEFWVIDSEQWDNEWDTVTHESARGVIGQMEILLYQQI